jgi:DNA polymerase
MFCDSLSSNVIPRCCGSLVVDVLNLPLPLQLRPGSTDAGTLDETMTTADPTLVRIARQHLQTNLLQGVEFVPIGPRLRSAAAVNTGQTPPEVEARPQDETPAAAPSERKTGDSTAKATQLQALRARHDQSCPHCTAVTYHTQTVFGEGDPYARLMFIGEAPGEEEDRTGRPFVGRAGQMLDKIIAAMGLAREQVYIANILKSRPPENRTPLQPEVDACGPFLTDQIRIIEPMVIVALGGPSSKYLLRTDTGITRLRGQWGVFEDGDVSVPVMPTFHPAYLLRAYTPENRGKVWSDMKMVLDRMKEN